MSLSSPSASYYSSGPSSSSSIRGSQSLVQGRAVVFSGHWIVDPTSSDSLDPLLKYHGLDSSSPANQSGAATPRPALPASLQTHRTSLSQSGSTLSTPSQTANSSATTPNMKPVSTPNTHDATDFSLNPSDSSISSPSSAQIPHSNSQDLQPDGKLIHTNEPQPIPALVISHNSKKITTYLHYLLPRPMENGLIRYDPVSKDGKLAVHEEYNVDGRYHNVSTPRGKVQARCYLAPHLQSLIVDTRCASKYDLERTERFLDEDGRRMIVEIRILTCDPSKISAHHSSTSGVSTHFAGSNAANQVIAKNNVTVQEVLFLRRVFRKILDADPRQNISLKADSSSSSSSSKDAEKENEPTELVTAVVDENDDLFTQSRGRTPSSLMASATNKSGSENKASKATDVVKTHTGSENWANFSSTVLYPTVYVPRSFSLVRDFFSQADADSWEKKQREQEAEEEEEENSKSPSKLLSFFKKDKDKEKEKNASSAVPVPVRLSPAELRLAREADGKKVSEAKAKFAGFDFLLIAFFVLLVLASFGLGTDQVQKLQI